VRVALGKLSLLPGFLLIAGLRIQLHSVDTTSQRLLDAPR
jgi:hypothetical protein